MPVASPLLRLFRHRLAGLRWLMVFVLVAKLALGTVCLASETGPAIAEAGQATVSATLAMADESGDCWHQGHGGCHCNCTHATPLASGFRLVSWPPVSSHAFVPLREGPAAIHLRNPLRPPIV